MASLADFVSEQRSKSTTVFSGVRDSFTNGNFSSKMSNSLSSIFSRGNADDTELLTESSSSTGQLPASKNRWVCKFWRCLEYNKIFAEKSVASFHLVKIRQYVASQDYRESWRSSFSWQWLASVLYLQWCWFPFWLYQQGSLQC